VWQRLDAISLPINARLRRAGGVQRPLSTLRTYLIQNFTGYTNSFLARQKDDFEHHARRDEGIRPVCWSSNALPLGSQLSLQVARRLFPEAAVVPVNHTATPWRVAAALVTLFTRRWSLVGARDISVTYRLVRQDVSMIAGSRSEDQQSHEVWGRRWAHGWAASICVLSASSVASSEGLPTSCTDNGRPSPSSPHGTAAAGWPGTLNTG
jgi:hypothetical protein